MKLSIVQDKAAAKQKGFAAFNNGRHLCVDLEQENATISVRSPDGGMMTIAFVPRHEGVGHQCADIVYHSGYKSTNGYPLQKASFLGAGPTIAHVDPSRDLVPTTVVTVQMYQTVTKVSKLLKQS